MISFDDELAEALVQTGAEITSAPPLSLPDAHQVSQPAPKPRRLVRWLAPAAAAVAVAAIAATLSVLAVRPHGTAVVAPQPTHQHPPHSTNLGTEHGTAATGGIPRYYIALTGTRRPYAIHSHGAGIYSTASGNLQAKILLPPKHYIVSVTAAADDRTFGVAATYWQSSGQGVRSQQLAFYLLRFTGARVRIIHVVKSLPGLSPQAGPVLSPDGTRSPTPTWCPLRRPNRNSSCWISIQARHTPGTDPTAFPLRHSTR